MSIQVKVQVHVKGKIRTTWIRIRKKSIWKWIRLPQKLQYIPELQEFFNAYFLHGELDKKSCFMMFFHEWNEWKKPQFNFSNQNLSLGRNFFKWDGKVTKIWHLLFHRIWKNKFSNVHQMNSICQIISSCFKIKENNS